MEDFGRPKSRAGSSRLLKGLLRVSTRGGPMKKLFASVAAAALLAMAGAAHADSQITFTLEGQVESGCTATANGIDAVETVALNGQPQTIGSVTYRCDSSFTRTISSANGGVLRRIGSDGGADDDIPYTLSSGGGSGLGFSTTALSTPVTTDLTGSDAFRAGQTGSIVVTPASPPLGIESGTFTDVVTITIVATS